MWGTKSINREHSLMNQNGILAAYYYGVHCGKTITQFSDKGYFVSYWKVTGEEKTSFYSNPEEARKQYNSIELH